MADILNACIVTCAVVVEVVAVVVVVVGRNIVRKMLGSLIPACERQVCLADVSVRVL